MNVASCGISASTADLVNRSRVLKSLGSKLAYDVASVIVLLTKRRGAHWVWQARSDGDQCRAAF